MQLYMNLKKRYLMPKAKAAPSQKRALLIVDAEPRFVTPRTRKAIPAIQRLILSGEYSLFVVAEYTDQVSRKKAVSKTLWQRAYGNLKDTEETVPEIGLLLQTVPLLKVVKTGRSLFGSDQRLAKQLRRRGVTEVHLVGLETHDCVLASAFDAYDHNFMTFVLSRACASKRLSRHQAACRILRGAKLLK